jgi:hypothetical protein
MVLQTGQREPDRIVGIHRDFGARGATQRLFAKSRPVDVVPPKRTGLHFIERAIQVCNRIRLRQVVSGGLGRTGRGNKKPCSDQTAPRTNHISTESIRRDFGPQLQLPTTRDREEAV